MEIGQIISTVTDFFRNYPLVAAAVVVGLLVCLYRSPKETFKFFVVLTLLAVAGYFVMQFSQTTSTSVSRKDELTHKTQRALGE